MSVIINQASYTHNHHPPACEIQVHGGDLEPQAPKVCIWYREDGSYLALGETSLWSRYWVCCAASKSALRQLASELNGRSLAPSKETRSNGLTGEWPPPRPLGGSRGQFWQSVASPNLLFPFQARPVTLGVRVCLKFFFASFSWSSFFLFPV